MAWYLHNISLLSVYRLVHIVCWCRQICHFSVEGKSRIMQSLSWLQWSWELPDPNPLATEPLLCKTRTVADRRQLLHLSTFAIFTCHANYWRFCFILWMMHIFCHFCLYIIKLYIYYIYLYVYRLQYLRCLTVCAWAVVVFVNLLNQRETIR